MGEIIFDSETYECYIEPEDDDTYEEDEEYLTKLEQILEGKNLTDYGLDELIIKIRENI